MKTTFGRVLMVFVLVALVATSCKDRDAEKKISQLESRLAELEGSKKAPAISPAVTTPAAEEKPEGPLATMQFESTDHDFGTIKQGDVVVHTYKFKNTGEAPLIIQSAQGSCGCTVPEWSKEPIPVGGTGFVTAKFDSQGKQDVQSKTVTVSANTFPKQTVLKFKAMVLAKEAAPVK